MSEQSYDPGALLTSWQEEFRARILDLQRLTLLRTRRDDTEGRKQMAIMFASAAEALSGLEQVEAKLRAFIIEERKQMIRAQKLKGVLASQKKRVEYIMGHLPREIEVAFKDHEGEEYGSQIEEGEGDKENVVVGDNQVVKGQDRGVKVSKRENMTDGKREVSRDKVMKKKDRKKKVDEEPIVFVGDVTEEELRRAPSYVKGRLKLDKVNAVVEKINAVAESKYRLLAKPRSQLTSADFDKLMDYEEGDCDETDGRQFVTDADIRKSGQLRLDATTKGVINLLRHVGGIKEIRGKKKMRIFLFNP